MNQINGLVVQEEETFLKIYTLHSAALLGIINGIVKDKEVAESILEEVFVTIWQQSRLKHQGYQRLFSWLSIVARQAAQEYINKSTKNTAKFANSSSNLPAILDLIYYQGLSQSAAAEKLNIPLAQVRSELRSCIMATRNS